MIVFRMDDILATTEQEEYNEPSIKKRIVVHDGLRELVAKYIVDLKHSPSEASIAFGVKANTASKIAHIYRTEGRTTSRQRGGAQANKLDNTMKLQVR